MFLNYKFSSSRSLIKEENKPLPKEVWHTHFEETPMFHAMVGKMWKATQTHTCLHQSSSQKSPPVNLYIQMHPGTYTYTTLLMLYTFIAPLVFFLIISYVKPSLKPKKKDVRLTWGKGGEDNHFRHSVKM